MNTELNLEWLDWINDNLETENANDKIVFLRFMCLWMDFNKFYNKKSDERFELERIKETCNSPDIKIDLDSLVNSFKQLKPFKEVEVERCYIYNYYGKREEDKYVEFNDSKKSINDFLRIIYKVRCNLIHGNKMVYENQGLIDVEVVQWAYESLKEFLEENRDVLNAR
ncbi:MAG: hypothetical protein GY793_04205 [Proteobacteria bacterium]|nr:hypothetical protein [Pseudomonadota bacterium]